MGLKSAPHKRSLAHFASNFLYARPRVVLLLLLGLPLLYMLVVYLGSLASLLLNMDEAVTKE